MGASHPVMLYVKVDALHSYSFLVSRKDPWKDLTSLSMKRISRGPGAAAAFAVCLEEGFSDLQQSLPERLQLALPLISLCFPSAISVDIYAQIPPSFNRENLLWTHPEPQPSLCIHGFTWWQSFITVTLQNLLVTHIPDLHPPNPAQGCLKDQFLLPGLLAEESTVMML